MRNDSITLKLVLDKLGCEKKIERQSDRINIQKEIYLVQRCGVNLGYKYKWHIFGPYSKDLTSTYYDMDASLKAGEIDYQWYKISDKFDDSIKACKGMLKAPDSFCANTTSDKDEYTCWIEFLSSVDYLYHNKPENVTEKEIKEFLKEKKGSIVKDFDKCFESAYKTLLENNLISDN